MEFKIIAHRGASAYAPENTLSSIKKAIELGARWVEIDVAFTADKQLVIFHDTTLNRTSNAKGKLKETTLQQLHSFDFGSWFNPKFANEKILTFEKLFHLLQQTPTLSINVELKPIAGDDEALAQAVFNAFQQFKLSTRQQVLFTSTSFEALSQLHQLSHELLLGMVVNRLTQQKLTRAEQCRCKSLSINQEYLTQGDVDKIHQQGYQVLVYTVNSVELAKKLMDFGVDGIFTDYPDLLRGVCE